MAVTNPDYITQLTARINTIPSCDDISDIEARIIKYFSTMLTQCNKQISNLSKKTKIPTDLASAIAWIKNFIEDNILSPYQKALLLLSQLIIDYNNIAKALSNAIKSLKCLLGAITDTLTTAVHLAMTQVGMTVQKLENGVIDAFQDQTGINVGASTLQKYHV